MGACSTCHFTSLNTKNANDHVRIPDIGFVAKLRTAGRQPHHNEKQIQYSETCAEIAFYKTHLKDNVLCRY
jgi:hypothetical protein